MASNCHLCGRKLGVFTKVRHLDHKEFCMGCAVQWPIKRKALAMEQLWADSPPTELFVIPDVRWTTPDYPKGKVRGYGPLSFTDKGVIFVEVAEWNDADTHYSLAFALVGAAVASSKASTRRKQAIRAGREGILQHVTDFHDLLNRAMRLEIIPRAEISDITWSWWNGFRVHHDKSFHRFQLSKGKKTYRNFEQQFQQYLGVQVQPQDRSLAPPHRPAVLGAAEDADNPYRT